MTLQRCLLLAAMVACATLCGSATAIDTIQTYNGAVSGDVTRASKTSLFVDQGTLEKEVPANIIQRVAYDNQPRLMTTASGAMNAGRYEEALAALEEVKPEHLVDKLVEQEHAYLKAYVAGRLALAGTGDAMAAAQAMAAYRQAYPEHYHFYDAAEMLGDLAVRLGRPDSAEPFYKDMTTAPWEDYQMRGKVALARSLLGQNETAKAETMFREVLASKAQGGLADAQRLTATLGMARCLTSAGKADDAIELTEKVIDNANPDNVDLLAEAYNALGAAHRKAKRPEDAVLAYLHVDVLYRTSPKDHVEALRNLVELWREVDQSERANQAAENLRQQYGLSSQ